MRKIPMAIIEAVIGLIVCLVILPIIVPTIAGLDESHMSDFLKDIIHILPISSLFLIIIGIIGYFVYRISDED